MSYATAAKVATWCGHTALGNALKEYACISFTCFVAVAGHATLNCCLFSLLQSMRHMYAGDFIPMAVVDMPMTLDDLNTLMVSVNSWSTWPTIWLGHLHRQVPHSTLEQMFHLLTVRPAFVC